MILHPLSVSKLPLLDFGQFINRFTTDFTNQNLHATADADFNSLYEMLVVQSTEFGEALKQVKAKAESEMIIKLDEARDKKITTLRRALQVAEHTDDESEKAAYVLLKTVLEAYKDIQNTNYEAESLGIEKLVAELRKSAYLPSVQLLGLEKYVDILESTNTAFKAIFDKRSTNTINSPVYDTKKLRKTLEDTYKEMADYIVVMAKRKNIVFYTDTLTVINNGRKYFSDLLAKRQGSKLVTKKSTES